MNDLDLADARSPHLFDELAAGFVLHGLDPTEEELFAMDLDECSLCRQTVAELIGTLGELALDIPAVEPPPELGQRIREAAQAYETSARTGTGPVSVGISRPRDNRPAAGNRPGNRRDVGRRSGRRKAPGLLTTAAVVAALVLGSWNVVLQREQSGSAQAAAQQQNSIRELATGHHLAALFTPQGHQVAYVVSAKDGLSVVTDGVSANQIGRRTYWLWALRGARKPVPIGSFDVSDKAIALHHVDVIAAGPADSATAFAVSVEQGQRIPVAPSIVIASGSVQ